jgi:uncharacterized protein (DUF1810 family)
VLAIEGRRAPDIFSGIDAANFRSSRTLVAEAAPDEPLFPAALARNLAGHSDPLALDKSRCFG